MYLVYSLLLGLALVVALPWWLFQMARNYKYRSGLAERFGRVPERLKRSQSGALVIWVHAVSVGEVLAVSSEKQEWDSPLKEHIETLVLCHTPQGVVAAKGNWRKTRSPLAKVMAEALKSRRLRFRFGSMADSAEQQSVLGAGEFMQRNGLLSKPLDHGFFVTL